MEGTKSFGEEECFIGLVNKKMKKRCLLQPCIAEINIGNECFPLEYSIHQCPMLLKQEIVNIFPEQKELFKSETLLIIPTIQPVNCEVFEFTIESEQEKNDKLHKFFNFCKQFHNYITELNQKTEKNYWFDYIDPVTGYPMISKRAGMTYSEVDACECLLPGYTVNYALGDCRLISHPKWKTSVYPATCFTTCPFQLLENFFNQFKT